MVFDELLGFSIKDFLVINFVVPRRGDEELLHLLAVDLLVQFLLAEVIFFLQGTLLFQRWRLVYWSGALAKGFVFTWAMVRRNEWRLLAHLPVGSTFFIFWFLLDKRVAFEAAFSQRELQLSTLERPWFLIRILCVRFLIFFLFQLISFIITTISRRTWWSRSNPPPLLNQRKWVFTDQHSALLIERHAVVDDLVVTFKQHFLNFKLIHRYQCLTNRVCIRRLL